MDITEFFQQSAGKWASQRTNHYLAQNQTEGAKSELILDLLEQTDPAVMQMCQQQSLDKLSPKGRYISTDRSESVKESIHDYSDHLDWPLQCPNQSF